MKLRRLKLMAAAAVVIFAFPSCEEHENETKISTYHSTDSHHTGENCMSCHQSGGDGEGWFTVAGTVYDDTRTSPFPNATVGLYTGPGGTGSLILEVEGDGLGNFYTTESVDFGTGIYVLVTGFNQTKHMQAKILSGRCNSCHGVSTDRIGVQ